MLVVGIRTCQTSKPYKIRDMLKCHLDHGDSIWSVVKSTYTWAPLNFLILLARSHFLFEICYILCLNTYRWVALNSGRCDRFLFYVIISSPDFLRSYLFPTVIVDVNQVETHFQTVSSSKTTTFCMFICSVFCQGC